ncbi:MAG: biotin--[acetyl-CoA-carboxylase] ligase [Nitrospiria bacterium]
MKEKGLRVDDIIRSLHTRYIGKNLIYLKSTDSTNLQAVRLGKEGSPNGALVIAEKQTGGKGRLNRTWISPPFANLYFSLLLRPPVSPQAASWIPLLGGVSISKGIHAYTGLLPKIKWPNDILMNGKKAAGILTELNAEGNQVQYLVLGIGLNVNMSRFSAAISQTATSLKKESGHSIHREPLLVDLLQEIEKELEHFYQNGPQTISSEWKRLSDTIGKKVRVRSQTGQIIEGKAIDLDPHGGLILEKEDLTRITVMAGDITYLQNINS